MSWSVRISGNDSGSHSFPLEGELVQVGRHSENTIALRDLYASRYHAQLRRKGEGWELVDLGSKAGTLLNGRRVSGAAVLNPGDEILIGRSLLVIVDEEIPGGPDETVVFVDAAPTAGTMQTRRVTDSPEFGLMRILVEAAREIALHRTAAEFQPHLLDLALKATGAERGVIASFEDSGELIIGAMKGDWPEERVRISRQVLARVRNEGEAVIVADIPSDDLLREAGTIISAGLRSVLCTPLGSARPARGILYLDSRTSQAVFEPSHFEVVATLAGMLDMAIENETAREALRERERNEEELQTAKTIMQRLVPPRAPTAPAGFETAGAHRSCHTIGGDFFSFFEHGDAYGMVLADVAGKGLSAALLVANFQAVWHHLRAAQQAPEQWLGILNEELAAYMPENRFITLAFAIVDPAAEELFFASAGHNPGLLLHHNGDIEQLLPHGPVLGLMRELSYRSLRVPFHAGDRVLLNSDGVTDQLNPAGEEFGQDRLDALVKRSAHLSADALIDALNETLEEWSAGAAQVDDITVTLLGRTVEQPGLPG